MRKLLIGLSVWAAVTVGSPSLTLADLMDGILAHQRGDYAAALKEFRALASQGVADALYNLGLMFDRGQGVKRDYKEAMTWWRMAAEQEHAEAQYKLGVMYENGRGVIQDYKIV